MRSHGFPLLLLLVFQWGFSFVPSESFPNNEVEALAAFRRSIYEDPRAVLSDWNADDDGDYCRWSGLSCSQPENRVLSINLSNASLKGFLPPEIGLLTSLQELILDNNLLLGIIPKQIGQLRNLTVLDLSVNRFSGPIPSEIGNLVSIRKINLHANGLTGNVPPGLGNLPRLAEVQLDRNKLSGPIPGSNSNAPPFHGISAGICQLKLKVADFSYNFFIGKIPKCLEYLPRSSFQGNCFQDRDAALQRSPQRCSAFLKSQQAAKESYGHSSVMPKHKKQSHPRWLVILEVATGAFISVLFIMATATAVKLWKSKPSVIPPWKKAMSWKGHVAISLDTEILKNVSRLSRHELEVACEDFSNIIGSSPDCIVYKGTMKGGPEIAVLSLCISEDQWTDYLEFYFQTKVSELAMLNHENTAKLLGYCKEHVPFSRMLVFDYASNGTLYEHLHYGEVCQLSWIRRMKIAVGIARGLRYLHTELQPPFALCELSSSSVYLTEDFFPKLVDFDSWTMVFSKSEKNYGYIPNGGFYDGSLGSLEQRHADVQDNTFAFGVLLLEIISGRPPYCKERGCLVSWAMGYLQQPDKIQMLVDPEVKNVKTDELAVICSVVSLCIEPDPSKRPSMQIMTGALENGIDTSAAAVLKDCPLAWAELAISS